jgi:hypothetical protein
MTVPPAIRPAPGEHTGPAPHLGLACALARAFTTGLHAAFYASMGFMVHAAVLSAIRGTGRPGHPGRRGRA